jgi:hypothetical protein
MKFKFKFSATFPEGSGKGGGTFNEGILEVEDISDLPEATMHVIKNVFKDWETYGQTNIKISVEEA